MHTKNLVYAGKPIDQAKKVLILLHGRGGSAEDILSLARYLEVEEFGLIAPQATNNTWYPFSFLAPPQENEPWLGSALMVLESIVDELLRNGKLAENIYFLGFSQGACLTLEYVARNAARYGGVAAFTGGLIGDRIRNQNYGGSFEGTPVFIGTSDPDPHVPVERVYASANILRDMKAEVTEKIYPNMGHTITQDEIDTVNRIIFAGAEK